jgi:hypothetical protein
MERISWRAAVRRPQLIFMNPRKLSFSIAAPSDAPELAALHTAVADA